mmetsp:Transcript_41240/g.50173  ORF Transcript_41240/g.50173 Transcript_41240/m.50173 type:complete len:173 (+) Transcript_41240:1-519(+)
MAMATSIFQSISILMHQPLTVQNYNEANLKHLRHSLHQITQHRQQQKADARTSSTSTNVTPTRHHRRNRFLEEEYSSDNDDYFSKNEGMNESTPNAYRNGNDDDTGGLWQFMDAQTWYQLDDDNAIKAKVNNAKSEYGTMYQTAPAYWSSFDWILFGVLMIVLVLLCKCCCC